MHHIHCNLFPSYGISCTSMIQHTFLFLATAKSVVSSPNYYSNVNFISVIFAALTALLSHLHLSTQPHTVQSPPSQASMRKILPNPKV